MQPLQAGCELHLGVKPNFAVDVTLTLTLAEYGEELQLHTNECHILINGNS